MALPLSRHTYSDYPEPEDLGQIKNSLGILSKDSLSFYPKRLLELYPNATDLAEMLNLQRTQIYSKRGLSIKKGTALRKRIIQLVIATDLAFALLNQSVEKTAHWLTAPNLILFGETPMEVLMKDDGEALISWLMERLGLKSGAAF